MSGKDLFEFFADPEHFRVIYEVNGPCPPLSLRTIAWFVNHGIELAGDAGARDEYARELKANTRRLFDPFRRCDRIEIALEHVVVTTTLGQMNFFRWLIESGVWGWLLRNRARVTACAARTAHQVGCRGVKCAEFRCIRGPHVVSFD